MSAKPRGLGRGLNALFEDEETTRFDQENTNPADISGADTSRKTLGIDQLEPGRAQPRKIFDNESLDELAQSIAQHGVLQPLLVRIHPDNSARYEIIAGERRWRAAQKAKLHEVPVIIKELSDEDALEIALIENLQREDLNPVDEAMSYKRLMDEYSYTQEKLGQTLGKSRSYIANMLRLLSLSDVVLAYLERGDISIGHARALVTSDNQDMLARRIVEENLSVRDIEKIMKGERTGDDQRADTQRTTQAKPKDADTIALEEDIYNKTGMRTKINASPNGSGSITLQYQNLDQLDSLIEKITGSA